MKLFIISDLSDIHTKRWVSALAGRGIEIFLFGINKPDEEFYKKLKQVTVFRVDVFSKMQHPFRTGGIEKLKYLSVVKILRKKIQEFQPDIVHAHYASSNGLLGALSGFHPFIVSVWGSDVYDFPKVSFLHRCILKYTLKKADKILSTSHVMALETHQYTPKEIEITPFGVNTDLFKKIPVHRDDTYIIGNVKTLLPKYGIDVLIKAFQLVVDRNADKELRLEIVGTGPDHEKLEQLAKSLEIADKVHFIGQVENSSLPSYYNRFLVAVSASVWNSESFGVVAVEAMACECPVVTSDADGFTEVVKDGETGFIVPKKDVEKTAEAIQKFIDHPELRDEMGRKGRERVLALYDWNKNVDMMVDIYQSIYNK